MDSILNHAAESSVHCPQEEKLELHEAESFVWDQTMSCFTDMTLEDYDKDGEYLATVPCNAQAEDETTDTADLSEEVSKHILNLDGVIVLFFSTDTSWYTNTNIIVYHWGISHYSLPSVFWNNIYITLTSFMLKLHQRHKLYPFILCVYQIKAHLKEGVSFSIEHVHNDYSVYENVCINPDEFRHVIEIYDFPPMFKTDDLLDAFTEYRCEQNLYPPSVCQTWLKLYQTPDLANTCITDVY